MSVFDVIHVLIATHVLSGWFLLKGSNVISTFMLCRILFSTLIANIGFTGSIPSEIGIMKNLTKIDLGMCYGFGDVSLHVM